MDFFLGFLGGIVFCLFVATLLILFRKPLEQKTAILEKQIEKVGMFKSKGFIYMPPDEDEEARAAKIAENQAHNRPTKLSDL